MTAESTASGYTGGDFAPPVYSRVPVEPSLSELPFPNQADESFRGQLLGLRGRIRLTQRQLAERLAVHVNSIQSWEAGLSCPSAGSLRRLIAVIAELAGFSRGKEQAEALALWTAAQLASPRLRTPFDQVWFQGLLEGAGAPSGSLAEAGAGSLAPAAIDARRQSWGDAPDVGGFLGRASARTQLTQWAVTDRSRVIAVLGLGGIGKSLLATRVAHDVAPDFERVFWCSLRDATPPAEWLAEAIGFLAPNDPSASRGEAVQARRLLELLNDTRCLLILDNFETVLQPGIRSGEYRAGYERYGMILRQVAEAPHQSCLIVTSREEPLELGPLRGEQGPVRTVVLTGLSVDDGRALLRDKALHGDDAAWQALIGHCGGNGLALKVVGDTIREVFGGSIASFLDYATSTPGVMVGGMRHLLGDQIQRLSDLEHRLLRCLAVEREPVGLSELAADVGLRVSRTEMLDATNGLRRRSLLERTERGALFGLHPVVLEYVTEQVIHDVTYEVMTGNLDMVLRQPLLKADGKDYVRRAQERLICAPIVERLIGGSGYPDRAERRLITLLNELRARPREDHGYGPGNIVNLLRLLRGDLKRIDLSALEIRQAYLQDVDAQDANLAGSHLAETVFGEAFSLPMPALALSADGAYLAVGMTRGEICRWQVSPRTLLATMQGHVGAVVSVAMSADGRLVASGGTDGTVRLWDGESGRNLVTLNAHSDGVWGVALSDDGRLLASAGIDGVVRLWEASGGHERAALAGHSGAVWRVAVSGDGRFIASGGSDGTVRLWRVDDGHLVATLDAHDGGVWGLSFSDDGRLLASGGEDGTVRVWTGASGELLKILRGHAGGVRSTSISGDGCLVTSTGTDGTLRFWETARGEPLPSLHRHQGAVRVVALSRDGRLVATCGVDGTVQISQVDGGRRQTVLRGLENGVTTVAMSRDSRLMASGSHDGLIRLRDTESGQLVAMLRGHVGSVRGVALSEDGRTLASGGFDGTVRRWATETGQPLAVLDGHTGEVYGVALSGDGQLIASVGVDTTVRLWEAESGRALAVLSDHTGMVWSVALSGDGRIAASGGVDGTVRLWDAQAGRLYATLRGHAGLVYGVALSRDGVVVVSGSIDGTVRLWDATDGRSLATLHGHKGMVYDVAISGDGRLAVSSGVDATIRLWEVASRQQVAVLHGHVGRVGGVAVNEDGTLVVSGGGVDGTVRTWNARTGECLRVSRDDRRYERTDITGLGGVTEAQRQVLLALGAVDRSMS